jgi:hypothetical protein
VTDDVSYLTSEMETVLLQRITTLEQRADALQERVSAAQANNERMLALLEKLYRMQSSIVGEIRDQVVEIKSSLPQMPVTINQ